MAINTNINSSSKLNYNDVKNNSDITSIKTKQDKNTDNKGNKNIITEVYDFYNEQVTTSATNEIDNFIDGLPLDSEYADRLKETLHQSWKDDKFYSEKGFIRNLDKILEDLHNNSLEISPLLNACIKQQFPELNITINEKISEDFINFLFTKNSNFDNEKPYKEFSDIIFMDDDSQKAFKLIDFFQKANSSYSLDYSYLSKNIKGFDELVETKYKDIFGNILKEFMNYNPEIYDKKNIEKIWNDILKKDGKDIYKIFSDNIPNFRNQLTTYASRRNLNIRSIDTEKAFINIINAIPTFMDLLSKLPDKITLKNVKDIKNIKNFLEFIGVDNLGNMLNVVADYVFYNGEVIYTEQSNEYIDLNNSISSGTYQGNGLINPEYHQDNSTTTTTVANNNAENGSYGGGGSGR